MAPVLDRDRLPGDVIAQPLRHPPGLGFPGLREQDRELLPAEPSHQAGPVQVLGHRAGDALQHLVSGRQPRGLVHAVEVVDVHHDQGERRIAAPGTVDLGGRLALPCAGVEQAGLAVDPGLREQLRLHQVAPAQHHRGQGQRHEHRVDGDHQGQRYRQAQLEQVRSQ